MTPEQAETQEIWQSIEGSGALIARYGYYPTLHDAWVVDIDINFDERNVLLTFEYSDLDVNENNVRTKLKMRWTGVLKAEICLYANDVSHISFRKTNDGILTEFEQAFGMHGSIESIGIELDEVGESERDRGGNYEHTPMVRIN